MNKRNLLLYLPASLKNDAPIGGQVVAARGLIEYISNHNINYDLVDHGNNANTGSLNFKLMTLKSFSSLLYNSCTKKYDNFLCFHSSYLGLIIRFIPALILRIKGCKTSIFFRNASIYEFKGIKLYVIKLLLSPYSLYFTQGSNLKNYLVSLGFEENSIKVIPSWLSPNFSIAQKNITKKTTPIKFVFASRIVKDKGIYPLVEAFRRLIKTDLATLDIYGSGSDLEALNHFINSQGLDENITTHGSISHDKLMNILKDYDVFILPSFHEGFPNAILEAFSMGLPVITSNVGEISDTVINDINGYIIDPRSPDSIREAINMYILNPSLISKHSEAALETISSRHDWSKNCSKLLNELTKVR